jgi:hypothetical protein
VPLPRRQIDDDAEGHAAFGLVEKEENAAPSSPDLVSEPRFLMARSFFNGDTLVLTGAGWGLIDTAARFTIPPTYEVLSGFEDATARATLHGVHGFIDRENRGVWGHRTALDRMI